MCLIVFAWQPGQKHPLVVAANRDEFYARPSKALASWTETPQVYAGRDLQAGGTWLGVGPHGRFAALTNIREQHQSPGRHSRGELVSDFLSGDQSISDYFADVGRRTLNYAGFNLLLGDRHQLWHFNSRMLAAQPLSAGVYGVSNAGLDTPWPKLLRAKAALTEVLGDPQPHALLALLNDPQQAPFSELPDTGVGLATEKLLSSVFIASTNYGTRASTALIVNADGSRVMVEHSFGPHGGHLGEVHLTV